MIRTPLTLASLALFTFACGAPSSEEPAKDAEPVGSGSTGGTSASNARPDPNEKEPAPNAPLVFAASEGWTEETPANPMRKAQYVLPGAPVNGADATAVVFHFPAGAGTVDANIERWASQFEQADGSSSMDRIQRMQRRVDGMLVHEVQIGGRYVAETSPGSGERLDEAEWKMMAAVFESDHGNYYLKCVGPRATIDHWAGSIRGFVTRTRRQR